jgi:predicted small secreted protein
MLTRNISALFALCAIALAACGGGVQGRYLMGEDGEGITLELRGGDVAVVSITGLGSTEGTYTVDGDTVTVRMPDGDLDTFTIVDGNLVTSGFGENLVFEKQ